MLGKSVSRGHFEIFFPIFPRKQALTFHVNCLRDNLHEMSKPVFWGKNKNDIINLSSAKLAHRVVKVKFIGIKCCSMERHLLGKASVLLTLKTEAKIHFILQNLFHEKKKKK